MITLVIQCVVAFVATVAFATLYNVPKEYFVHCGITGGAGWACYSIALMFGFSVSVGSLFAAIVLTLLSRFFAAWRCCPITVFLICGIFPLVPGAGIYYTAYHFIMGETALFAAKGTETLKIAVAIALGIVLVSSLPQGLFNIFKRKKTE